eukprot:SM000005S17334  [mRNA]  locus=s5:1559598:1560760:- [translate_table: standard]
MSRPMALGIVLLVLFLTSQSEWRPAGLAPSDAAAAAAAGGSGVIGGAALTAQQKATIHRDSIKEKIIFDLTTEAKRLEAEQQQLLALVADLRKQLATCSGPSLGGTAASVDGNVTAAVAAAHRRPPLHAEREPREDEESMQHPALTDEAPVADELQTPQPRQRRRRQHWAPRKMLRPTASRGAGGEGNTKTRNVVVGAAAGLPPRPERHEQPERDKLKIPDYYPLV